MRGLLSSPVCRRLFAAVSLLTVTTHPCSCHDSVLLGLPDHPFFVINQTACLQVDSSSGSSCLLHRAPFLPADPPGTISKSSCLLYIIMSGSTAEPQLHPLGTGHSSDKCCHIPALCQALWSEKGLEGQKRLPSGSGGQVMRDSTLEWGGGAGAVSDGWSGEASPRGRCRGEDGGEGESADSGDSALQSRDTALRP